MATVWDGAAVLAPSVTTRFSQGTQRMAAPARLSPSVTFGATPQSLFDLLQNLMDSQEWDATLRTQALTYLIAYHVSTVSNDKFTAVKAVDKIHKDVELLLDHVWNVFGVRGMQVDRPDAGQLAQLVSHVSATRSSLGLLPLPGPSS